MSPFVRYSFAILIALYGFYQLSNDRWVPGLIGVAVGVALLWFARRR